MSLGGTASLGGSAGAVANCTPGQGNSCGCRLTNRVELTNELARRSEVRVYRAKSGFVLSGFERNGVPPFILASWQGEVASSNFDISALGLLLNVAPIPDAVDEERLLMVDRGPGQDGLFGIRSTLWQSGSAVPIAQTVLFGADYYGQVVTSAIGRSGDGERVIFSYGNRILDPGPTIAELGPDGFPVVPPRTLTLTSKSWDSLAVVPTPSGGALSALAQSDETREIFWNVVELDAGGEVTFQAAARIDGITGLSINARPRITQSAGDYVAGFPSGNGSQPFLRLRRTRAPDAPAEVWQPEFGLHGGLDDFAALEDGFLFLHRVADELVVQRVDATGAAFALPLVLADTATLSYTPAVSIFDVVNTTAYVSYATNEARVIAEIDCSVSP